MASERPTKEKYPLKRLADRFFQPEDEASLRNSKRVKIAVHPDVVPTSVSEAAHGLHGAKWARAFGYGFTPVMAIPTVMAVHALTVSPTVSSGLVAALGAGFTWGAMKIGKSAHSHVQAERRNLEKAIATDGLTYKKADADYPGFGIGNTAAQSHPTGSVGGIFGPKIVLNKKGATSFRDLLKTTFTLRGSAPERLPAKLPTSQELTREYSRTKDLVVQKRIDAIFALTREVKSLHPDDAEYVKKAAELKRLQVEHVS